MALQTPHPGHILGGAQFQANATIAMAAIPHTPHTHPRHHTPAHTRHDHKLATPARNLATRHLVATPLDADIVDVPVSLVVASVLQADAYVSATPCSRGTDVTGSPWDDISGLQQWLIQPVGDDDDAFGEYTIAISSGRDECHQRFLGAAATGNGVALYPRDDGSGRQRWVFKHVGEASSAGVPVYSIRLAGGKKDEYAYLGLDRGVATPPDVAIAYPLPTRMRLYASSAGPRKRFALVPVPIIEEADDDVRADPHEDPHEEHDMDDNSSAVAEIPAKAPLPEAPSKVVPPAADARKNTTTSHIPADMAEWLRKLTKMSLHQLDVVLQLVSLPENSTPQWHKNYGYIEFLGDGRGFTTTIFGACSGTGDLIMVFDALHNIQPRSDTCDRLLEFTSKLRSKRGDDIRGIEGIKPLIQKLGNDPAWQRAVWTVYVKLYWKFAMEFADKRGAARSRPGPVLHAPAARGFMLDTAINHGANMDSLDAIVRRMPASAKDSKDERTWALAFAEARRKMLASGYDNLDTSGTGHRCTLWAHAIKDNPSLDTPFQAFKGYWGSFTLV